MLDAFKTMTGCKGKLVQKQTDDLELLIATAREERSAISAMLTALTTRSAKLTPLGKTLEQVSEKATGVTSRLDEITKRLTVLDDRTKELAELDKRIQSLKESARQAEQTTQKALGPDGELQKHREAVQHLSSQALGTQATLDTLKKERATLEELRGQLQKAEAEGMKQVARADDTLARTEKLTSETTAQLEAANKLRQDTENETTKLKKEAGALLDAVRGQVDTLALKRKEFEAFDLRLRTLHSDV